MNTKRVEFAVRCMDEFGDVFDVNHYWTLTQAKAEADWTMQVASQAAIVVEREEWDGDEVTRQTVYTLGSEDALKAGGWDQSDEQVAKGVRS